MIVSFIGVIGTGKNFRQALYAEQGFVPLDFKDSLLYMASDLVGYDVRTNYEYFKYNLVGLTVPAAADHRAMQRQPAHQVTDKILTDYPSAMTGRLLLQRLGTEVMRKRNPDYWTSAWYDAARVHLLAGKSIAVADCRFYNEVEQIKRTASIFKTEAKFIFCDYRSSRYNATMKHESERMAQELLALGYKDGQELNL